MDIKIKHILLSFVIILVGCDLSFSQTRISEKFESKPLFEVLEMLSKSYKIKFAYDNSLVSNIFVSGDFQNEPIDEVLRNILKETSLEMLFIDEVYIIKLKVDKPKEESLVIPVKPIKYRVLGIVKEKETGESLPYATIAVAETRSGTSTNTDGYFTLTSEKSDSLTLLVNYLGFKPYQVKVAPLSNNDIITIELNRNITTISEVVVVKTQQELLAVEGSSGGAIQWNSKKNSDPPSLSNLDIAAPLQLLPGVDGTTESLSGLVVRHSPSDKNLFVYDGFTIYHIDHFFGAFTSFNAKAIKDIRITRGGFDSRWGGRASSVIEITGKTGDENKLDVDIGTDQLSSDVEVEGPIGKKTTFVFAARRSFTDIYHSQIYYNLLESARSDIVATNRTPTALTTNPDLPVYYFYDMNAKVSFKPGLKDVISISGYQGYDNMRLNTSQTLSAVHENSNWGNQGLGIRWSRQWNNNFYHSLTAGISQYNLYYDHLDYKLRKKLLINAYDTISHTYLTNNNIYDLNLNYSNELKMGSSNSLEFGVSENNVSINSKDGNSHYYFGDKIIDTVRIYDNRVNNLTLWAQNTISYKSLKAFKFGGRVTYNSLLKKYYFEPRTQLAIQFSEKFSIKMAAGIYYQFVNKLLTFSNTGYRSVWKISEGKNFPVVKSDHLISGFIWDFGGGFNLDFEGYYKYTTGISFEQTLIRKNAADKIVQFQKFYVMSNKAIGADFLLKKNWRKGQAWISYSLSKSLNKSSNINKGDEYPALDDHLSELKIVNVLNVKHWNLTVAWIYGSGNPWDKILFLPNTLQVSSDYKKNSAKLPPYHRMDVGLSYNLKIYKADLKIGAKIFNLYNNVNTLSKPYQISEPLSISEPIVYNEIPGMGFTTSFFINLRF